MLKFYTRAANNAYIAMGLSLNNRVGDSSVIECVRRQTVVSSHTSWTEGIEGANRIDVGKIYIKKWRDCLHIT